MTDPAPPPSEAETPTAVRQKRSLARRIAIITGIVGGVIVVLLGIALLGGRAYLLSEPGRELVSTFANGKKIGRYGRINVEGLQGDLFNDFTLSRVTVTDEQGVWIEITDLRVDWSYLPLLARRFHADTITAGRIHVLRRPILEISTDPPGAMPLDVDIDHFAAEVELHEDFSQTYGHWRIEGDARVLRRGLTTASVDARSLDREGDFLKLEASLGKSIEQMELNLQAHEARGGPLAGMLGYSPDQPFVVNAVANGRVIDATARTGAFVPLRVQGRFSEEGSRASGYVNFSGSDLFAPFIDRIGRTARFGLAGIPLDNKEGVQAVAWRLYADNITTRVDGQVKTDDLSSPDGLAVDIATPSLSRLAGVPLAGASTYVGTFTGKADRWELAGQIALTSTELASYRAQRLEGPVRLAGRDGGYALTTELAASGGSRSGMVGGLLGASPQLSAEVAYGADGSVLLRRIDLTGEALRLNGSGGRALNGSLRFTGEARITDVSSLSARASGSFGGPIRATSSANGGSWTLGFEGRGRELATGMDELDRLLGPTPSLNMAGTLRGGRVEVTNAVLEGARGQATGRGLIEADGALKLAVDWSASGPFGVGPIEIDGAMQGDGALTGTMAEPRLDLTAGFEWVNIGPMDLRETRLVLSFRRGADASDGRVAVTGASAFGPARAVANFYLGEDVIRLSEVNIDAGGLVARGSIGLSNSFPSSADLAFVARPGAFLSAGEIDGRLRLTDAPGQDVALIAITGRGVRLAGSPYVIRTLQLGGRGSLSRLPFNVLLDVGGPTPVQFRGDAVYSRTEAAQSLALTGGGQVRDVEFSTRNPMVIAFAGDGHVARVDMNVGGGILLGELRQGEDAVVVQADLTRVELGSVLEDLRGQVTGRVALRGSGDDLSGSANVTLAGVRSVDAPANMTIGGTLDATLVGNRLDLELVARGEGSVNARIDLRLPVVTSAAPLRLAIARTGDMSGEIDISGQIKPIWDVFVGSERSLAGQVEARATLAGSLNAPRINGTLALANGDFRDSASGLRLNNMVLNTRFDDTTALIQTFTAGDGAGGTVSGNGRIGLREGSGSSLKLDFRRFRVIDNEIASARGSGELTVTRATDGNITLVGDLTVDEARIEPELPGNNGIVTMDVVEINRPGGDPDTDPDDQARGPQIGLNIGIRSRGGNIEVSGRGLNVLMNIDARVRGTLNRPILSGTARVVRGDYEFAGKRFVFDEDGYVELSTNPRLIRLNLEAVREDPVLTASIRVTGTAEKPEITLTSTPALPQDEILSQVLFGRSASQLSPVEAAQLASGVASLAGGGGFDVIGGLRELAGLDRLSFGGEASALTVAGGRYISDDVYLEVIGGGEGGAAVSVEWQVRRNLAVTSRFGGQGEASLSVRWRRESLRPGERRDRRPNRD
ncbi:MAG: translocation/assembly module TamB domain-containing protein [Brevundimonas sp.]|nr:translocation/assembly module TamB domain-containing protein [Brevundimonas sp.]